MADFETVIDSYKNVIPVPLVDIARDLNVKVFLTKRFKDSKSGEITKENGHYVIYLNANHSYGSNRFTLAHELAHFKFDRSFLDAENEIEDYNGKTFKIPALNHDKEAEHDKRELKADQFAAELLMPEDEFVRVWDQKSTIEEVASFFEVSTQAAEIRARIILEKRLKDRHEKPIQATAGKS